MQYELTQEDRSLIDYLMANKPAFDEFVYTPWREAITALETRQGDSRIAEFLASNLSIQIPEQLEGKRSMIMCRNLATPNFETLRFITAADVLSDLQPVIFEHTHDIFADINDLKKALAKVAIYRGRNYQRQSIIEYRSIASLNEANGKPFSALSTLWGQPIADFHRELLHEVSGHFAVHLFDASQWYYSVGRTPFEYYRGIFSLFLKHGIMFENFFISKKEGHFTSKIVLPRFIEIWRLTGHKPLIVTLDPLESEEDPFWLAYPTSVSGVIDRYLNKYPN